MFKNFKRILNIVSYNLMLKKSKNQATRDVILKFIDIENKTLTKWKSK